MAEENLSKRERQKKRREAKKQAEQAERARARRRRLMGYAAVVLILVGLVGAAVWRTVADRQAQAQRAEEVAQRLDDVGCSEIEQVPNMGAGHFGSADELAAAPPELVYETRPAPSGRHMGQIALTGVYDQEVDERLVVHNLEHGYVVLWYDDEAEEVDAFLTWAEERIGDYPKVIAAKYHDNLPEGNYAAVAWDHRQVCEEFDPDVFQVFLDEHHNSPTAPEATVPAHTDPDQGGVLDPDAEEGPLLFPPLGDAPPGVPEMPEPDLPDEPVGPVAPAEPDPDEGS